MSEDMVIRNPKWADGTPVTREAFEEMVSKVPGLAAENARLRTLLEEAKGLLDNWMDWADSGPFDLTRDWLSRYQASKETT